VFLDEICNVSAAMQTKLLRVVQEQKITRVGGVEQIDIDVRFVAATNRDLAAMVKAGDFREDLYHRLNVVRIEVPPLRERDGDIVLLIEHFVHQFNLRYQRNVRGFDEESLRRLQAHDWPGNVRELKNLVERHVVLAEDQWMSFDEDIGDHAAPVCGGSDSIDHDLPDLKTLERRYIDKMLRRYNGNREQTAQALGINKSTLWRKLQQQGG
jgi:DNA-binding NtrC family response regulator